MEPVNSNLIVASGGAWEPHSLVWVPWSMKIPPPDLEARVSEVSWKRSPRAVLGAGFLLPETPTAQGGGEWNIYLS